MQSSWNHIKILPTW